MNIACFADIDSPSTIHQIPNKYLRAPHMFHAIIIENIAYTIIVHYVC